MSTRRLSAAVLIGVTALGLAACGGSDGDHRFDAVDLGETGEIAEPGTELSFHEPAWIDAEIERGDETVTETIGLTVRAVIERDASVWDEFDNADEFAGEIPWAIIVEQKYTGEPYDTGLFGQGWFGTGEYPTAKSVWPLLADDQTADLLYMQFGSNTEIGKACGVTLPTYDAETNTVMRCLLAAVPEGQELTGALYDGTTASASSQFEQVDPEANPYFENPVIWRGEPTSVDG